MSYSMKSLLSECLKILCGEGKREERLAKACLQLIHVKDERNNLPQDLRDDFDVLWEEINRTNVIDITGNEGAIRRAINCMEKSKMDEVTNRIIYIYGALSDTNIMSAESG